MTETLPDDPRACCEMIRETFMEAAPEWPASDAVFALLGLAESIGNRARRDREGGGAAEAEVSADEFRALAVIADLALEAYRRERDAAERAERIAWHGSGRFDAAHATPHD